MIKLMDVGKCNWMVLSYSDWNEVASLEAGPSPPRQRLYLIIKSQTVSAHVWQFNLLREKENALK